MDDEEGEGKKKKKMMMKKKGWKILVKKGTRMKVMKLKMRGKKERKMKEKTTNEILMDSNFLKKFSSPGASCSSFFPLLCSVALFFDIFFFSFTP